MTRQTDAPATHRSGWRAAVTAPRPVPTAPAAATTDRTTRRRFAPRTVANAATAAALATVLGANPRWEAANRSGRDVLAVEAQPRDGQEDCGICERQAGTAQHVVPHHRRVQRVERRLLTMRVELESLRMQVEQLSKDAR